MLGIRVKSLLIIFLVSSLFLTRFINLNKSATFLWDNTIDLVKIHQYFHDRKITMVGPISEDGNKVYGSLSYYMLMPFAILGRFDPLSTTIGAAFWGTMAALLLFLAARILNKKISLWILILVIIWFPLVETSRWAWNPNLMIFWITLGVLLFQIKNKLAAPIAGFSMGLSIHNHYLAIVSVGIFLLMTFPLKTKRRETKEWLLLTAGVILSLLPFVLFDLRHPPGLFLSRALYFNQTQTSLDFMSFVSRSVGNLRVVLYYYTHSVWLMWIVGIAGTALLICDVKRYKSALIYFFPWFGQIVVIGFINNSYFHYFLPGLVFFVIWIAFPRAGIPKLLNQLVILTLIIGSITTILPQIKNNPYVDDWDKSWHPNIKTVKEIVNTIESTINERHLTQINLAVLGSQDANTVGLKYRNLLLIDGYSIKDKHSYFTSDNLFVISQVSETILRRDPAAELNNFRNRQIEGNWSYDNNIWKLYLFNKN